MSIVTADNRDRAKRGGENSNPNSVGALVAKADRKGKATTTTTTTNKLL